MEQSGSRFPASPLFSFPDISLSLFLSFPEMGFPQHIHGPFIPNPPEPPPPHSFLPGDPTALLIHTCRAGMGAQQWGCTEGVGAQGGSEVQRQPHM